MKRFCFRLSSAFLCLQLLNPTFSLAQVADNEIRVLAVSANGVNTAAVIAHMDILAGTWPGSNGAVIDLANGGVPVPLSASLSGTALQQLNQAIANPLWNVYRNTWGADLMIVFTPSIPAEDCGLAVNFNWNSTDDPIPGQYVGDPLNFNLDLRGSSNGFSAIVQTTGDCPTVTTAHEVTHLLGSGHTDSDAAGFYLTSTSHAAAAIFPVPFVGFIGLKTIGAQGGNPSECSIGTFEIMCLYISIFSDGAFPSTPAGANTQATFVTTALSVANYFAGSGGSGGGGSGGGGGQFPECDDGIDNDGDGASDFPNDSDCASLGDDDESDVGGGGGGGCGLQAPANLVATLVGVCSPFPPYTQYTLTWTDACASATFNYELHRAQPTTSGFVFVGNSFVSSTPVFITGASALAKVRACGLVGGCSGFSNTVMVVDGC